MGIFLSGIDALETGIYLIAVDKKRKRCMRIQLGQNEMRLLDSVLDSVKPHKECPLVEVKTPHGRLIDESKIKTVFGEELFTRYDGYVSRTERITNTDAPTVIEAEVE